MTPDQKATCYTAAGNENGGTADQSVMSMVKAGRLKDRTHEALHSTLPGRVDILQNNGFCARLSAPHEHLFIQSRFIQTWPVGLC